MSDFELTDDQPNVNPQAIAQLHASEVEAQVSTAHKFPRSIKRFRDECTAMATLTQEVAEECMYSLPRSGKMIVGPSIRFAEIIASAWGNCRVGSRIVADDGDFITAQGVFHDLERNMQVTREIQRRVTDKHGKRFNADMIGVTGNAASSIALRNAVLNGIPKAFWAEMFEAARKVAVGDNLTIAQRRTRVLSVFAKLGAVPAQVFAYLGIAGEQDITIEHLEVLFGIATSVRDGNTPIEEALRVPEAGGANIDPKTGEMSMMPKEKEKAAAPPPPATKKTPAAKKAPPAPEPAPPVDNAPAPVQGQQQDVFEQDDNGASEDDGQRVEAPAPAQELPPDRNDGNKDVLATGSEKGWLQARIAAKGADIAAICAREGVTWPELTADGFIHLRSVLGI